MTNDKNWHKHKLRNEKWERERPQRRRRRRRRNARKTYKNMTNRIRMITQWKQFFLSCERRRARFISFSFRFFWHLELLNARRHFHITLKTLIIAVMTLLLNTFPQLFALCFLQWFLFPLLCFFRRFRYHFSCTALAFVFVKVFIAGKRNSISTDSRIERSFTRQELRCIRRRRSHGTRWKSVLLCPNPMFDFFFGFSLQAS